MRGRTLLELSGLALLLAALPAMASEPSTVRVAHASDSAPAVSADGRYVAFDSRDDLIPNETNSTFQVYVHDMATGTNVFASVSPAGEAGTGPSSVPSISANGRYVVFRSMASDLVPDDENKSPDGFVHDMLTGLTERVTVAADGHELVGAWLYSGAMSTDGRYVVFVSSDPTAVPGDTNTCPSMGYTSPGSCPDVFVRDRDTDGDGILDELGQATTLLVSVSSAGEQSNGYIDQASISPDGRYVAFTSHASNLVPGVSGAQIYLHDLASGETTLVSASSSGVPGNDLSVAPSVSSSGLYVAFVSHASNLSWQDPDRYPDVYVRDVARGTTLLASVPCPAVNDVAAATLSQNRCTGQKEDKVTSWLGSISANGRYVSFWSQAGNLVPDDTNGYIDSFMRDLATGETEKASVSDRDRQWTWASYAGTISPDGRYVAFPTNLPESGYPGITAVLRDRAVSNPGSDWTPAAPPPEPAPAPSPSPSSSPEPLPSTPPLPTVLPIPPLP